MRHLRRVLYSLLSAIPFLVSSQHAAYGAPQPIVLGDTNQKSQCSGTRCGCSTGAIPVQWGGLGKGTGGIYNPGSHDEPGALQLPEELQQFFFALNNLAPYTGIISVDGFDPAKARLLCNNVSRNPWTALYPDQKPPGKGKKRLPPICEVPSWLDAIRALCHELGHYEQCGNHNHPWCEDECEQYTKSVELINKCCDTPSKRCKHQARLEHELRAATFTCGAAFNRCFLSANPATDKAPGSCVNECLNTPPLPSPRGAGAAGGGGATAQSIQQEIKRRELDCANLANLYRVNCATKFPYCGDGVCQQGEDPAKCPLDCRSQCGNGLCEHDENGSSCLKDCCTPEGQEMRSPDRLCCQSTNVSEPYVLPYGKVCRGCAPEGFKPQGRHTCCFEETGQLYLISNVCKLCADKGEKLVPGAKCCEGKRLFEHNGICVYDPTCAETGAVPPIGGRCCNAWDGIVTGRCGLCANENTDYVQETLLCCDGLDRVTDRAGIVRCVKRAPPNGGMPTNPCVASGQPCTPGTTQCCSGGTNGCRMTSGGKYLCS